jgi:hypothetical protein
LIAYDLSGTNNNALRSPLKVISYLASGKCVVSNIDCEIPLLSNKAIFITSESEGIIQNIARAMKDDLKFEKAAVQEYLDNISYERLLERIFISLGMHYPKKGNLHQAGVN